MARIIFLLLLLNSGIESQSNLRGRIISADIGEPIPFVTIAIYKNGILKAGTDTDFDGRYFYSVTESGMYDIVASFLGYAEHKIEGVILKDDVTTVLNFQLQKHQLDSMITSQFQDVPHEMISSSEYQKQNKVITAEDMLALPTKEIVIPIPTESYQRVHNSPQIILESVDFYEDRSVIYKRAIIDGLAHQTELRGSTYYYNNESVIFFDRIKRTTYPEIKDAEIKLNKNSGSRPENQMIPNSSYKQYDGEMRYINRSEFHNGKVLIMDERCYVSLYEDYQDHQIRRDVQYQLCKEMRSKMESENRK